MFYISIIMHSIWIISFNFAYINKTSPAGLLELCYYIMCKLGVLNTRHIYAIAKEGVFDQMKNLHFQIETKQIVRLSVSLLISSAAFS